MVPIKVSWCLQFWQKALQRTGTYHFICIFAFHYAPNCIPPQQFFPTISENIISDVWNKCLNVNNWWARKADLWRISFFQELPWYDSRLNFLFVFDNTKEHSFYKDCFFSNWKERGSQRPIKIQIVNASSQLRLTERWQWQFKSHWNIKMDINIKRQWNVYGIIYYIHIRIEMSLSKINVMTMNKTTFLP